MLGRSKRDGISIDKLFSKVIYFPIENWSEYLYENDDSKRALTDRRWRWIYWV
jgi:hypothetical protein